VDLGVITKLKVQKSKLSSEKKSHISQKSVNLKLSN